MKSLKLSQRPRSVFATSTLSLLLCAAVLTSCGSSKSEKKAVQPTAIPTDAGGTIPTTATPSGAPAPTGGAPTQVPGQNSAPVGKQTGTDTETSTTGGSTAAPVGRVSEDQGSSGNADSSKGSGKKSQTSSTPDFKEAQAVKTGGKVGSLNYTSASSDGIMDYFLQVSTTVGKDQQTANIGLAQAITGARLKKSGAGFVIDMATNELGQARIYRMSAAADGDSYKLSALSSGGDMEFQGGYLKCLDNSCDNAYAKIKMSGAYTRIIFRTMTMDNHFLIQKDIKDSGFLTWKTYIENSVMGAETSARIASITASSYEVLNGKAAMGLQLLTQDNEALVLNTLLVAPENGTAVAQKMTKVTDLSDNYNLAPATGKAKNLSNLVNEATLINNNGKGALKIKLAFNDGSIWMVTSPVKNASAMTVEQVKAFKEPKF